MPPFARRPLSRRAVLRSGLGLSGAVLAASTGIAAVGEAASATVSLASPKTPEEALSRLLAGNARFSRGKARNPGRGNARRVRTAQGQKPYAAVLTCADSRVPPELVFDEGLGDLFTVRVAGNTATDAVVIGSIEYAVAELGSLLIFVLGHSACGAVKAAIDVVTKGATLPGNIGAFVAPIVPAVEEVKDVAKEQLLEAAIERNVHRTIAQLSTVDIIRNLVDQKKLLVAGGEYELESGKVDVVT